MINVDKVRRQVKGVMMRFPSHVAEVRRPSMNEYNEPTDETEKIGEVTFWWAQPSQPKSVKADERGVLYQEDERKWACMIWDESLPDVHRGDLFVSDGKTWRIRNTETRLNVRVFWQLEEV